MGGAVKCTPRTRLRGEAVTRLFALLRFLLPVLIDLLCLGLERLLARSAIVLDQAAHLGRVRV